MFSFSADTACPAVLFWKPTCLLHSWEGIMEMALSLFFPFEIFFGNSLLNFHIYSAAQQIPEG